MNFSHLLRAGQRTLFTILPEIRTVASGRLLFENNFHTMSRDWKLTPRLLETPQLNLLTPVRELKTRGVLQLRCKDCYIVARQGRWFVMCKTHPRHKQQKLVKKEEKSWILTHATQHKNRPW